MSNTITHKKTIREIRRRGEIQRDALTKMFFPNDEIVYTEQVVLDLKNMGKSMAVFVSPIVGGKAQTENGQSTKIIENPPYVESRKVISAETLFKREAGEAVETGAAGALQRKQAKLLGQEEAEVKNKIEYMVGQFLQTGKINSLDGESQWEYDYAMSNKVTLTGEDLWNTSTSDPVADIETAINTAEESGEKVEVIVLGQNAANDFINNTKAQALLDNRRIKLGEIDPKKLAPGFKYLGTINYSGVDIYSYNRSVTAPDGSNVKILADNAMVGGPIDRSILYAPIINLKDKDSPLKFTARYSDLKVAENGKTAHVTTETRPVFEPGDMAGYFSWVVTS
ncbi:major capsid protein [Ilyobacter polytropus]|uniref:Phage major capsid protein E n=1 Tax=Ilyobacter polytropus (strain ATCC 51220 / DSM 2926 / LMG 16218 / CuHBu1) TaxID=572544 RepID=E3HBM2_ILYPC|nr:major capsid protein [Ilyobacter polytropus]ADO83718.1 hypothetical protein Ilyop_1947 [Ilyobacter polytropus DSM 2926]